VPAANADGAASTLEVFVNDVQWHEADGFFAAGPRDRQFITRTSDDGKTTVEFGDGKTGARLPTGVANVRATYRKGIGVSGNVKAGQLSLLMTRPLGVSRVTNPVPASGGADPEPLESARANAPLGLLTLGRIVSLGDYQDFARAFAGIAKALATWTWDGQARGIFVTVSGPDGAEVPADGLTCQQLLAAMQAAGDPRVRLRVATFTPAPFSLTAALKIDPDYQTSLVAPQVEQALRDAFSFAARDFGQPVALSEIYAVISNVPGIIAAEISALYRVSDTPGLSPTLVAAFPLPGANGSVAPAELLTLDPRPLQFGILT
jgi:predicted phage baseplate assembly protein